MVNEGEFRHLYPFKSNFLNIDGHNYHYVDEGKGDVIVMLHGNPTWSFFYRNLIGALSKTHRVIAPDHMGCGFSDKPQQYPYTLSSHIKNITRLLDYLGTEQITLIVHDWGGPIGLGYAIRHLTNIKRVVLMNTAGFITTDLHLPFRIKLCRYPGLGDLFIRRLNLFSRGALCFAVHQRRKLTKAIKKGYLAPYDSYQNRVAQLQFVKDIPWHTQIPSYPIMKDIENHLLHFKEIPTLILWGDKDFCFTTKFLKKWRMFLPHAQVKQYANAGHYILEDESEKALHDIYSFLRS